MTQLKNEEIIDVWKTMIEVQLHFSQMEMATRNIFVTIMIAIIAGVGFVVKERIGIVLGVSVSAGTVLCIIAIFVTWLFYFVDRYWYHQFLLGTGEAAGALETYLSSVSPAPIGLGASIGGKSPVQARLPKALRWLTWPIARDINRSIGGKSGSRYIHEGRIHSEAKISLFYKSIMVMFALMAIGAQFATIGPARDKTDDSSAAMAVNVTLEAPPTDAASSATPHVAPPSDTITPPAPSAPALPAGRSAGP